jgi:hypothetical protein
MHPPDQEEAAGALPTPATAHTNTHTAILDEEEERRKFERLQTRAVRAGFALVATSAGYLLTREGDCWYSSSVDQIAHFLAQVKGGAD